MIKDIFTILPDSGNGNGEISISCDAATDYDEKRTSIININGGGITKTVNVSRAAKPHYMQEWMPLVTYGKNINETWVSPTHVYNTPGMVRTYWEYNPTSGKLPVKKEAPSDRYYDFGSNKTLPSSSDPELFSYIIDGVPALYSGLIPNMITPIVGHTFKIEIDQAYPHKNKWFTLFVNDTMLCDGNSEGNMLNKSDMLNYLNSLGWTIMSTSQNHYEALTDIGFVKASSGSIPLFIRCISNAPNLEPSDSYVAVLT